MPCDTEIFKQPNGAELVRAAVQRLEEALAGGKANVVISSSGAVAFAGWRAEERNGLSDLCAYRKLAAANSPALRRAMARAEAISGRKVDARQVAAGVHSHDGGKSWGSHEHGRAAPALLALVLAIAAPLALAHPGHGLELEHQHGELALVALIVGALVALFWRRS